MNLWIFRYYIKSDLPSLDDATKLFLDSMNFENANISFDKFNNERNSFISVNFDKNQKFFHNIPNGYIGYSGIPINNLNPKHKLVNVTDFFEEFDKNKSLSGAFSFFKLQANNFKCFTSGLGFHRVYYYKDEKAIYVSNHLEYLAKVASLSLDRKDLIKHFFSTKKHLIIDNNTFFKGVKMLPEYGELEISEDNLNVTQYNNIENLFSKQASFNVALKNTTDFYKATADYLSENYKVYVTFSGGFDSRVNLALFHNRTNNNVELVTYNRQSKMDTNIAKKISKKFKVKPNLVFLSSTELNKKIEKPEYSNTTHDPFNKAFFTRIVDLIGDSNMPHVIIDGNGGDTDWDKLEPFTIKEYNNFEEYLKTICQWISNDDLLANNIQEEIYNESYEYLYSKYSFLKQYENYIQLFNSAFFHLEKSILLYGYKTQYKYPYFNPYGPFKEEQFLKLVFSSEPENLNRRIKTGIHYQLYKDLTDNEMPYAPIIRDNNWQSSILSKWQDNLFYFWAKASWKLFGGDTNTQLRRKNLKIEEEQYLVTVNKRKEDEMAKYLQIDLDKIRYGKIPLIHMFNLIGKYE